MTPNPLAELRDRALEIALTQVGVKEVGGNNRGPQVEVYLASVGLGRGLPWCAAFVYWAYREASRQLSILNPLPRTPRCVRMWQKSLQHWLTDRPSVGAIFVHLAEPSDQDSDGHVGIVTDLGARTIGAVEGNTNAVGSRLGDQVRVNLRSSSYVHGYIDIGRDAPMIDSTT